MSNNDVKKSNTQPRELFIEELDQVSDANTRFDDAATLSGWDVTTLALGEE